MNIRRGVGAGVRRAGAGAPGKPRRRAHARPLVAAQKGAVRCPLAHRSPQARRAKTRVARNARARDHPGDATALDAAVRRRVGSADAARSLAVIGRRAGPSTRDGIRPSSIHRIGVDDIDRRSIGRLAHAWAPHARRAALLRARRSTGAHARERAPELASGGGRLGAAGDDESAERGDEETQGHRRASYAAPRAPVTGLRPRDRATTV
jgi:hypothetical protein